MELLGKLSTFAASVRGARGDDLEAAASAIADVAVKRITDKLAREVWMALGFDPLNQLLYMLGFAETRVEAIAKEQLATEDTAYREVFLVGGEAHPYVWLRACGLSDQAANLALERQLAVMRETVLQPIGDGKLCFIDPDFEPIAVSTAEA